MGPDFSVSFWSTFARSTGLVTILAAGIIGVSTYVYFSSDRSVRNLARAFSLAGVGVVTSIYFTYLFPASSFAQYAVSGDSGGGTLGNSSFAGGFLIFSFVFSVFLIAVSNRMLSKLLWGLAAIYILVSPVYTGVFSGSVLGGARGASLAIVAGALCAAAFWLSSSQKQSTRYIGYGVSGFLVLAGLVVTLSYFTPNSYIQREMTEVASGSRILYNEIALRGAMDKPIFGWGWEHFPRVQDPHFDTRSLMKDQQEGIVDKPHNAPLEYLVTAGIPALALYLLLFLALLYAAVYSVRTGKIFRSEGALFFGLFIAYFLQNIFVFDTPATYLAFFVAVGVFARRTQWTIGGLTLNWSGTGRVLQSSAVTYTSIALVFVATTIGIYVFAFSPLRESMALASIATIHPEARKEYLQEVYAYSGAGGMYDQLEIASSVNDSYVVRRAEIDPDHEPAAVEEILQHYAFLKEFIESGKATAPVYATASRLATLAQFYDSTADVLSPKEERELLAAAEVYAREAIRLAPQNPTGGYWPLARIHVVRNELDEAVRIARQAVNIQPELRQSHDVLLQIALLHDDKTIFTDALQNAEKYFAGERDE
jgi:O-antigen ligase